MDFIHTTSNYLAKNLANKVPDDKFPTVEDQIEVYDYGFQVVVGAIIKGLLLVGIALILGIVPSAVILTLTFSSLRVIAGGYHMNTYGRCITVSLIMFLISALISQYTYQYWTFTQVWFLFVFTIVSSLYIIYRYVPRDNPNKPITEQWEIAKFKRWSYYYIIGWIIVMTILLLADFKLFVISSSFGLLLELFTISDLGYYKFFSKLESSHK